MPGAHRIAKFAQYLPEFGWTPTVLTPDWNSVQDRWTVDSSLVGKDPCEVIRVPFPVDTRKLTQKAWLTYTMKFFPQQAPFKLRQAMEHHASDLLRRRAIDVIVASSPTAISLTVARRMSTEFGIPFVADLRDIPDELSDRPSWIVRRAVRSQTAVVNDAVAIVTNSPGLAERLASRHSTPIRLVYNGYEPADYAPVNGLKKADTFDIVYCGSLPEGRKPKLLFEAIDRLLGRADVDLARVRVCFYGIPEHIISRLKHGHRCQHLIHCMGRVPHDECIRLQQRATVLLLLSHREGAGPMPSKVFEYLGAQRPILSIPGDVTVSDILLKEARAGLVGSTPGEIAHILCQWINEWLKTGRLPCGSHTQVLQRYTRRNQTSRLAEILQEAVSSSRRPRNAQRQSHRKQSLAEATRHQVVRRLSITPGDAGISSDLLSYATGAQVTEPWPLCRSGICRE